MNTVYLAGAEGVERAGHNIAGAAETMQRAAFAFDCLAERLMLALDEHAARIEAAAERIEKTMGSASHD